mmetsp:Transcript_10710/g.23235  ORF Transcript_10710/g.23235 Transcript_10710/m.23235 type:complete len:755 (-) Transcript_10710:141-2405(-)
MRTDPVGLVSLRRTGAHPGIVSSNPKKTFYPLFLLSQHRIGGRKCLRRGEEEHEHDGGEEEDETYGISCRREGGQGKGVGRRTSTTALLPTAIIGGSYAGLALANVLHLRSVPYAIFDCKSLPFAHVAGGAKFNVPSYDSIAKKLELNLKERCSQNDGPSRKEVIDSLLERVQSNLITSRRIVGIERMSGLFYLRSRRTRNESKDGSDAVTIFGPFQSVVGADGVLSKVRTRALECTFLIGDARWVNDRWYDLGLKRIDRGADVALLDAVELGDAMVGKEQASHLSQMSSKFCAREISRRRSMRSLAFVAMISVAMLLNFHRECLSAFQNMIYAIKGAVFFDDCLDHDRKNPVMLFEFHQKLQQIGLEGTYSLLLPRLMFWVQITVLILIQSFVSTILGIAIYHGIVQRRGSTFARILCWGFILPFAVTFPMYLIRAFEVRNRAVVITTAATPTLVTFRCLEALHGFSPHSVEESLWNYCIYYSSVIEFVFDEKTRSPAKASRTDVLQKGKAFLANFVMVTVLLSFMEFHAYRPFRTHESETLMDMTAKHVQPGHIGNNLLSALLMSLTVATGTAAFGFAICGLVGILTLDVFDSPMFKSTSVSDFWGRRWNRLVHGVLKRGVYKPVRKHSSRAFAALATFVASGLLHEYVLLLLSLPSSTTANRFEDYTIYEPLYGNQFCFFAWNGMLMVLEYLFLNWTVTSQLKLSAPPIVKTMLVLLMSLPVAHWFTDEYVRSDVFSHFSVGFPIIVQLKE